MIQNKLLFILFLIKLKVSGAYAPIGPTVDTRLASIRGLFSDFI